MLENPLLLSPSLVLRFLALLELAPGEFSMQFKLGNLLIYTPGVLPNADFLAVIQPGSAPSLFVS